MKPETSQELRGLVREVLKEAMANRADPKQGAETIRIGSDADLQAFISRISSPGVIESVRAGKLRFTLGHTAPAPTGPGDILEGVISEQKISALAGKGAVILGPTAVLTPLARDRARKLGLKIERRR
ncbi:MAG: hypothetical protein K8F90_00820 [Hyphomicrobiales bacterium]|nr:hypothetical protein [Hyphomicrobiales bacterium]